MSSYAKDNCLPYQHLYHKMDYCQVNNKPFVCSQIRGKNSWPRQGEIKSRLTPLLPLFSVRASLLSWRAAGRRIEFRAKAEGNPRGVIETVQGGYYLRNL